MSAFDPGPVLLPLPVSPPPAEPALKHEVTIQLSDDSTLTLSRETASKLGLIHRVIKDIQDGLAEGDKDRAYDEIFTLKAYGAPYIRDYLALMNKIDKGARLPDLRLSQLLELLVIAFYFDNDSSLANLPNYIFATILANQPMSAEVRNAISETYLKYPRTIKNLIMDRLAELNRTLSLKTLRKNVVKKLHTYRESGPNVAIDNQGKIVLLYRTGRRNRRVALYDETDSKREKLINSMLEGRDNVNIRVGGLTEQGIVIVDEIFKEAEHYLIIYPPSQTDRQVTITIKRGVSWEIPNHSFRLRLSDNKITKIYDLTDDSLIFQQQTLKNQLESYSYIIDVVMDDRGEYLLIIRKLYRIQVTMLELFALSEIIRAEGNPPPTKNKSLFEISIPTFDTTIATIDPYRQLIYIVDERTFQVRESHATEYPLNVILVLDFSGQVLHRYVNRNFERIIFYPTAQQLLTHERVISGPMIDKRPVFGMEEKDLRHIMPEPKYRKIGHLKPIRLPPYELWPGHSSSLYNYRDDGEIYSDNFWIRDVTDGFRIKALLQENTNYGDSAISSANGDYIVAIREPLNRRSELSVIQTVLYSDSDIKTIRNILEGGETAEAGLLIK